MSIKLYWMRGKGKDNPKEKNFGDYLSKDIVEMVSGEKVVWSPAKNADLLAIGTILNRLMKAQGKLFSRRVHVWGTGSGEDRFDYSNKHYYHSVRGPLTATKLPNGVSVNSFGDAGLLASELRRSGTKPIKRYRLGLIPHYVDFEAKIIGKITSDIAKTKVISVFDSIENIMESILECDVILSSSMHGLIVSDSLGIPNKWLKISDSFEEFKFDDYYRSLGESTEVLRPPFSITDELLEDIISRYSRKRIDEVKQSIWHAFPKGL